MTIAADPARQTNAVMRAVLWMLGSLVSFSVIAIAGREASRVISTTELMFWRGLIGVVVLLAIWLAMRGTPADLRSGQPRLQFARSIVHFAAQFGWLYALDAHSAGRTVRARVHGAALGCRVGARCSSASG